jgi:thioester reductase-like protein
VEDNFFELGGHSLLALKMLARVNQSFGCSLKVTDAYRSPTIREMAQRLSGAAIDDELVELSKEASLPADLMPNVHKCVLPAGIIVLTGAAGFVGRFLLVRLLQDTNATIYCIVRARSQYDASTRICSNLKRWDLWRDEFEPRIVGVPGDLRLPRLGVDDTTYQNLVRKADCIFHCATSMNHLETYQMAKQANVCSALELIRFATEGAPKLINYVSTLGVFSAVTTADARVVDERSSIDHERHLSSRGYVASKWVAEKIFLTANERGIPCNIFRLGLVCADTQKGRYDELQREYRVIKSCMLSGYGIKNYRYNWVPTPVDYVAHAIVCLASRHANERGVFHISLPGR